MGFDRARAAESVLSAFHEDPPNAAKEGLYEAWFASRQDTREY